jgi:hypothetical protein
MLKTAIGVTAASIATAAALSTIAITVHNRDSRQADINAAVCHAVVKLDGAITDSLNRSLTAIPKIQYYKDHPDERKAQLANIRDDINNFKPPPECGGDQGGAK